MMIVMMMMINDNFNDDNYNDDEDLNDYDDDDNDDDVFLVFYLWFWILYIVVSVWVIIGEFWDILVYIIIIFVVVVKFLCIWDFFIYFWINWQF